MSLIERESQVFFHTYKRIPLEVRNAEGVYLYDTSGKRYLDFFGGLAVNALGHCHPRVVEAIERQAKRYAHLSNYYLQDVQIELAEKLVAVSGLARVFLGNTGAEANEGAMKLARKWGAPRGKKELVGFTNSFHGRTFATLSLMDNEKYRAGIDPLVGNTHVLPFNDVAALRANISEATCAVMFEPIQGEGGIVAATQEFVDALVELRAKWGFLIIADEIQCGVGRTGKFFGYEHFGLKPDIVTIAKAIGGGLPLGVILGAESVADTWHPGEHGTTFGGNPLACAAGIVVLDELAAGVMANAGRMGDLLHKRLHALKEMFPGIIEEVRGVGLMAGLKLNRSGDAYVVAARERGVLINCTNTDVLRFLPPLIITDDDCNTLATVLEQVFRQQ